ncbi:MAG TPA: hypothetical protein DCZ01_12265 [Elusimicrobia bacterium]|nr:MAG: hypothetical protein A2X37_07010 [Elusimicrobia bacterium GWA2_66_18]OGR74631.1 MAG: hypothetical protein A2X40_01455 [Elusimicrobia bacterium GWC2_65_9]HAZ09265.1 hypothetical protein [Elusimicrobiota bacterium]
MTCRLDRRPRAALAVVLSTVLVPLGPGLEVPRLFAQAIGRSAAMATIPAVPGSPIVAASAKLFFTAAPAPAALPAAASLKVVTPGDKLTSMAKDLVPLIETAGKFETGEDASSSAGRTIIDILTGEKSAAMGEAVDVSGVKNFEVLELSRRLAASAAPEAPNSAVPAAAAPAQIKSLDSSASYRIHRFLLKAVAALTGAVYSLPSAGPALTQELIAKAADRRVVFSDYDDTLASYNQVLPEDMVSTIVAVKAAGKDFAVISDRGDEKRAHQLSVFESLATLPVETRAGWYVAANSGGRVYRYDEKGEPVLVFEAPPLGAGAKVKVVEAAEATKSRLQEVGAEQHFPGEGNSNPSESWGPYGYALMLKIGSPEEQVRAVAAILEEELFKRGLQGEVNARIAKNPANPPYVNFSVVIKKTAARYIADAFKVLPDETIIIGDSMYAPHEPKKASWLTRLGAKLSGREIPKTGNATDRNMEKALQGALTFGVGTTGDPRVSNLWVLDGKGPAVTRRVLLSMASKPRGAAKPGIFRQIRRRWLSPMNPVLVALGRASLLAAVYALLLAVYALFHARPGI